MKSPARALSSNSLAELREVCRRAEFTKAAAELDRQLSGPEAADPDAALLRARISLRLRRPAESLDIVTRHAKRFMTAEMQARAALLEGSAYARLGDHAAAQAKFERATAELASLESANELALRTSILYERAVAAWIVRDLPAAEAHLDELSALHPSGEQLLEAQVVRGTIAAARESVAEQGAIMLDALSLVHRLENPPVLHWAVVASQIAYLAREMPGRAMRDAAAAELGKIPWTSDLAEYRFTMLRAIGWRHALDGDYFNAFRRLKDARTIAPSDGWRVMALCDRAYFAAVLGERRWSEQELSDAHELAASVSWSTLDGEERFALCVLAELFAPRDSALALSYIAKYKESGSNIARTLASSNDRRVQAMESYSFGVVKNALGEKSESIRLLRDAWSIYDAVGYDWRAGRAAILLGEITGDEMWKSRGGAKLQEYENSWLRAPAVASGAREPAQALSLTPARRAVYDLLLQGLSTAQIAATQGRSEFTVRNHIKAIFKTFGVKSRPALIARATRTAPQDD